MLELCLGSYLVTAALATVLLVSALIVGRRADHVRYGIRFWSSLAQAKRDNNILFEVYGMDEEDAVQPEKKKVRLPRPVPPVDV